MYFEYWFIVLDSSVKFISVDYVGLRKKTD